MNAATLEQLRYPVGRATSRDTLSAAERAARIGELAGLPAHLLAAVDGLGAEQLEAPYRPGGWTLRQVVHHVADSHINSYIRFRLAATEREPRIPVYDQDAWAQLADSSLDVSVSLRLLDALHARWVAFLLGLEPAAFARVYVHPELGSVTLDAAIQLYAWHGRHHVAHIVNARSRAGW
jgi:uncharacterized damage-inducible protein DinB